MKLLSALIGLCFLFGGSAHALPKVTFAGDYDYNSAMRNTITNIKNQAPDIHFAVGDFSYGTLTPAAWCDYIQSKLTMPFELVMGNHDVSEEPSYLSECPDSMNQTGQYARQSYFDYGGARFISTDPDIDPTLDTDYNMGQPKGDWLHTTVSDAKANGEWVIVMTHKVCVAAGGHGCEIGEDFLDNLLDWGVDLVWQGHAHNYQRSKQFYNYSNCNITSLSYDSDCMRATSNYPHYPAGGMQVVINGTAGASQTSYQIDPNQPDYPYFRVTDSASHGPSTLYVGTQSLHMKQSTNADGVIDEFWIDR